VSARIQLPAKVSAAWLSTWRNPGLVLKTCRWVKEIDDPDQPSSEKQTSVCLCRLHSHNVHLASW
jgi:hypothetical protein